jgi:hypothetical protein
MNNIHSHPYKKRYLACLFFLFCCFAFFIIDGKGSVTEFYSPFNETIYAIGCGQIHLIFHDFPHQTVIVKHHLPDGNLLFSVYTHVEQVKKKVGDWVNEQTSRVKKADADPANPNLKVYINLKKWYS